MAPVVIAASQHRIQPAADWATFAQLGREQVASAAAAGAALLVFAEYGSLGLVPLLAAAQRRSLAGQLQGLQTFANDYLALYRQLAQEFRVWIVAPSFPLDTGHGYCINRAWITGPAGELFHQDKHHMTRFERELFDVRAGSGYTVVNTGRFRFGVAICYDVEFPLYVHTLAQQGAEIIAVPSCTDSEAGFHRVWLCARARAVENQCFVAQAPLAGEAPWCEAIDINVGTAGVFSPVDKGFPANGVLAQGEPDSGGWVIGHCDLPQMQAVRDDGQVLNWRDWP